MTDVTTATAVIVASAAGNEASRMRSEELVSLIKAVKAALSEDGGAPSTKDSAPSESKSETLSKAQWSKLLQNGKIKSLIDGKLYDTLKRHLGKHGHDPRSYRATFGLPVDFPMVSPQYSARRSAVAKQVGFGQRKGPAAPTIAEVPAKPARKPRAKKG